MFTAESAVRMLRRWVVVEAIRVLAPLLELEVDFAFRVFAMDGAMRTMLRFPIDLTIFVEAPGQHAAARGGFVRTSQRGFPWSTLNLE